VTVVAPPFNSFRPLNQPKILVLVLSALAASGCLLSVSNYVSATRGGELPYYLFWLAFGLAVLPIGWIGLRKATGPSARTSLILVLSFWSVIPKWVRTGIRPLYADEYQSFRLLENIATTGHPVVSANIIAIGGSFPGMEYLTYFVHLVTSLGLFSSAFAVAAIAHIAELMGAYALCSAVSGSRRAGVAGGLIFFLNPSFLFFDAQYAYETLSLALVLWGFLFAYLAVTGGWQGQDKGLVRLTRVQCGVMSILFTTAILLTHHVSSGLNALVLLIYAIFVSVLRRFRSPGSAESALIAWILAGFAFVTTTLRYWEIHALLAHYLQPVLSFGSQISQIFHFFGIGGGSTNRSPFGASSAPWFEVISAYLMVPILLVGFLGALLVLMRKWRDVSAIVYTSALLALMFFVSVPLTTSRNLVETAHRSWAYSFIGLAILIAAAVEPFFASGFQFRKRSLQVGSSRRSVVVTCVTVILCVAVVSLGSVTSGTSTEYRFPTKEIAGDDPNAINTQTSLVDEYFAIHGDHGQGILADRMTSHQISVLPDTYMVLNLYVIPLTFYKKLSWFDFIQFRRKDVQYVEMNSEMDKVVPDLGFWYIRTEPHAYTDQLVPAYNIYRYHCFNWMNAVYVTKDLTIYKVSQKILQRDLRHFQTGLIPACMAGAPKPPPSS
jgi:hypothetical protein